MSLPVEQKQPITSELLDIAATELNVRGLSLILMSITSIPEVVPPAELPDLKTEVEALLDLLEPYFKTDWEQLENDKLLQYLVQENPYFLVSLIQIRDDYEVFPLEALHVLRKSGSSAVTSEAFEKYSNDISLAIQDLLELQAEGIQNQYAFRLEERLNRRKSSLLLMYLPQLAAELGFDFEGKILTPLRKLEQEVGYLAEVGGLSSREAGLLVGPREVRDFMGKLRFMQALRARGDAVVSLATLMEKIVLQTAKYQSLLITDLCEYTGSVVMDASEGLDLHLSLELTQAQLEEWIENSPFVQRCLRIAQTDYNVGFLNFSYAHSGTHIGNEIYSLAVALVDPALSGPAHALARQLEKHITETLEIGVANLYHFNQHNASIRGVNREFVRE